MTIAEARVNKKTGFKVGLTEALALKVSNQSSCHYRNTMILNFATVNGKITLKKCGRIKGKSK